MVARLSALLRSIRSRWGSDAGITLIEMMVSLVILAMVSSGFAYGLQLTLIVTQSDRARVQASNLAARELETVRNEFGAEKSASLTLGATSRVDNPHPLPGQSAGVPLTIDGRPFTVTRTVQWLPAGTGVSPCDGGAAVTYPSLAVNVRVSWAEKSITRDVESNTVLTPPKGTLATVKGFVAAKVQGADGKGVDGVPVDISGPGGNQTRVTASDGCAVFALSAVGNYTVTLDDAGYVSFDGLTSVSKPATVGNGTIQVVPFSYDRAATLNIEFQVTDDPDGDFAMPSPVPSVVLFNPGLPTMGRKEVASGVYEVTKLWPFPNGYSVWAGTCSLNDPSVMGGSRPDPVVVEPGQTKTVEVLLKPVDVVAMKEDDTPLADALVRATITNTAGCDESVFTLGTTDSEGVVRGALPYGRWNISAGGGEPFPVEVSADPSAIYPLQVTLVG